MTSRATDRDAVFEPHIQQDVRATSDFSRWPGVDVFDWSTLDALRNSSQLAPGIHRINEQEYALEFLLHGSMEDLPEDQALPVFFSGAISERGQSRPPFFSGLGVAKRIGLPCICVSDPTLSLGSDLTLAWYAGSEVNKTQECVLELLRHLIRDRVPELLLIGGSGGGFAALLMGLLLGSRASVLVWNPQTNIFKYGAEAVDAYLRVAFPRLRSDESIVSERAEASLAKLGHRTRVDDAGLDSGCRRILYLQESTDSHVKQHAGPFISAHGLTCEEGTEDLYSGSEGNWQLLFGHWGDGHAAPPRELIDRLVQQMVDIHVSPRTLILEEPGLAAVRNLCQAPLDATRYSHPELTADVTREPGGIRVTASLEFAEGVTQTAQFAFYANARGTTVQRHWYVRQPTAFFSTPDGDVIDSITVFTRDGFDRPIINATFKSPPRRSPT